MMWNIGPVFQLVPLLIILGIAAAQNGLDGGTLLFLHVWKCGGTTLRELMCDWADREGLPCATVAGCGSLSLKVLLYYCIQQICSVVYVRRVFGCLTNTAVLDFLCSSCTKYISKNEETVRSNHCLHLSRSNQSPAVVQYSAVSTTS